MNAMTVEQMQKRIRELEAAVEAAKSPCTWTQGSENYEGEWDTSCVNLFEFNSGTPEENKFKFCPYCGRPIVQKLHEPEEDK